MIFVAQPKRKKPGAKPRAGVAASVRLELRLTPAERDSWQRFADKRDQTLAELVRASVDAAIAPATAGCES